MNTAIPAALAFRGLGGIIDAIERDHNHYYGLNSPICYGAVATRPYFAPFRFEDDILSLVPSEEDPDRVVMTIKAFRPEVKVWDGTTALPDRTDITAFALDRKVRALLLASLPHDVIFDRVAALVEAARAQGIEVKAEAIMDWANQLLDNLNYAYGGGKRIGRVVKWVCDTFGGLYHRINSIFRLSVILGLLLLSGCSCNRWLLDPDWEPVEPDMTGPVPRSELASPGNP